MRMRKKDSGERVMVIKKKDVELQRRSGETRGEKMERTKCLTGTMAQQRLGTVFVLEAGNWE